MITISNYCITQENPNFNKCIDIEVPIRVLLRMSNDKVQDFSISSPTSEDNKIGSFIANELEDKGIDIVLELINLLDDSDYEEFIKGI